MSAHKLGSVLQRHKARQQHIAHRAAKARKREETYKERKCLLELGDLLLGERISLRYLVSECGDPSWLS
jgi:hypothetical protein